MQSSTDVLNEQLRRGDFFLCASEKQRDFWLGQLAAVGRINPATYDRGENLEGLLAVAPFGVSDEPPRHTRPVLRGVVPGIGEGDKVVLWGGGIYNWFDPLTLLRAVDKLRGRLPEVRLYFLGPQASEPARRRDEDGRRRRRPRATSSGSSGPTCSSTRTGSTTTTARTTCSRPTSA